MTATTNALNTNQIGSGKVVQYRAEIAVAQKALQKSEKCCVMQWLLSE